MKARRIVAQLLENGPDEVDPKGYLRGVERRDLTDLKIERERHSTICLIRPQTRAGDIWIRNTAPEDAQFMGNAMVVELRYLDDVIDALRDTGLTVS